MVAPKFSSPRPAQTRIRQSLAAVSVISLAVIVLLVVRTLALQPTIRMLPPSVPQEIGQMQLAFIPNAGQTDPSVRFQASGMGGAIFFTPQEVVLALNAPAQVQAQSPAEAYQSVVRQRFVGAAASPAVEAEQQLPGRVNFLQGVDPAQWYTNLPTYGSLVYRNLYPGVDLRYEGTDGALKSTFTVAPGVDPASIRWAYDGALSRNTDQSGNLILTLPKPANAPANAPHRTLSESAPVAWQVIDGRQVPVGVDFRLNNDATVGFTVGTYNRAYPLIIDPTLTFSAYIGGNGASSASSVVASPDNNGVFLTGTTSATNFPTTGGAFDTTSNGGTDVFVSRVNQSGALVYSTYLGGGGNDSAAGIAVDSTGRAYVVGSTSSADFPVGGVGATFDSTLGGSTDGFVVRLSSTGAALEHGSYIGGSSNVDAATAVAVNASNEVFVAGRTESSDFPTANAFDATWGGGEDAFAIGINASGAALLYGTYLGGLGNEAALTVAVNGSDLFVGGFSGSADFPVSANAAQSARSGAPDGFVARLNTVASGAASLVYSTYLGGNGNDFVRGIAIADASGGVVVVGDTSSTTGMPTTGALFATNQGGQDAFVAFVNTNGGAFVSGSYFGGTGNDIANGVALQFSGPSLVGVAIAGSTTSINLPLPPGITQTPGGGTNAFATMFNANATALNGVRYSFYLGGGSTDAASALALETLGANAEPALYVAGSTTSSNFPGTNPTGPLTTTLSTSGSDAFLTRMALPTVTISNATTGENAGPLVFTVTVNAPANSLRLQDIRANYVISSGTALAGEDFGGALAGTAVFTPGQQLATITVPITDDVLFELDETLTVTLISAVNAVVDPVNFVATGTITNDDAPPTVAITNVLQFEGNGGPGATTFAFTTTLSAPAGITVTVPFTTSDNTAVSTPGGAGNPDFVNTTSVVTFAPGTTQTFANVSVNGDQSLEADEAFTVTLDLAGAVNIDASGSVTNSVAVGTILNDDLPPALTISDVTRLEGDVGTTNFVFTATLSAPSSVPVSFNYTTANGTALSTGSPLIGNPDYASAANLITFAPDEVQQFITVTVNGDTTFENNETFILDTGVILIPSAGNGVPYPSTRFVSGRPGTIQDVNVTLYNFSHTWPGDVDVVLIGPNGVRVPLMTNRFSDIDAVDLTLTFDDEAAGGSPTGSTPAGPASISYQPVGATSGPFGFSGVLPAGTDSATLSGFDGISPNGTWALYVYDDNGTNSGVIVGWSLDIQTTSGSFVDRTSATGTILNDDAPPALTVTDLTQNEGSGGGTTTFSVTVGLTATSGLDASFTVTTTDGTAVSVGSATPGTPDYNAPGAGPYTIAAGTLMTTVTIQVDADDVFEADETFGISVTSVTSATIVDGTATVTIQNDDVQPSITISDVTQVEGNSGTSTFAFTATLSAASAVTATADFATSDGTAISSGSGPGNPDFTAATGTITFTPGVTETSFTVAVNGDTAFENDETFTVLLTPTAAISTAGNDLSGLGTIVNDDNPPSISISDVTANEGDTGTTNFVFTATLSAASAVTATADFGTLDGTALSVAGNPGDPDFTAATGTITFTPNVTTQLITVTVNGDTTLENDETFTVLLTPTAAITTTSSDLNATGTIQNDDTGPTVVVTGTSGFEGTLPPAGQTPLIFTIGITAPSALPVTVSYRTVDGTALGNGSPLIGNPDYASVTTDTVNIPAGSLTATVQIAVNHDAIFENNEDFFVEITDATNATFTTGLSATGTILNDDVEPSITISDVTRDEGNTGTTSFVFTATLTASSAITATADFGTLDGTALSSGSGPGNPDFTAATGTITFTPGVTETSFTVAVNGDTAFENDETFTVLLTPTAAISTAGNDLSGLGTIVNDDLPPTVSISDVTANEGDIGTTNFVFTATLSAASALTATVDLTTQDGTALSASDYAATTGVITFNPGVTETTFTVPVTGDTLLELDETFVLSVTAFTNIQATGSDLTAIGTIVNDDVPPGVVISDVTQLEGDSGTTLFTITVGLTATSGLDAIVNWTTQDDTALSTGAGTGIPDFTAASSSVTIPAGSLTATFTINVDGDTVFEADETFGISVTSVTSATIVDGTATVTITNDDVAPTVSISDVTLDEGNTGTTSFVFTATLSAASAVTATVDFATSDNTALSSGSGPGDPDFTATTGTITFTPGVTETSFTVAVNGDTAFENDETFTVTLSSLVAITSTGSITEAVGTIVNDDNPPSVSISDVTANEGDIGTTNFVFTATLSAASALTATVDLTTQDGTALSASDYAATTGVITFNPGVTETTFTVPVTGDTTFEPTETFVVSATAFTNIQATGSDLIGTGTIVNDDVPPGVVISDVTQLEGDSGTTLFTITVGLTATSGLDAIVNWTTQDGTALSTGAGTGIPDFTAASSSVTIPAGNLTATFTINVDGDTVFEADETFGISVTSVTSATIVDGTATVTIQNDDVQPSITISDVTQVEGNSGTSTFAFTATLSAASAVTATADFATSDGTAISSGLADYVAASNTITFAPGVTQTSVNVTVNGDLDFEPSETFTVTLSNLQEITATGSITEAIGTIQNDDAVPTLSVSDASVVEGNAGTTNLVFTAMLSARSGAGATFDITTADGTAVAPGDYTAEINTLVTFAPNVTQTTFTITVNGDTLFEFDETLTVTLGSGVNLTIPVTDTEAIGTILNDDTAPTVTITGTSGLEGDSGTTTFTFDVGLSQISGAPATLPFATSDGTANAGTDYVSRTGTLVIPAGSTTGQITVTVNGDTTFEADETFFVTLVPGAPGTSGVTTTGSTLQATGTITNDDAPPTVNILDLSQAEGSPAGSNDFNITVELTAVSGVDVTIAYTTTDGTASSNPATPVGGADFTAVSNGLVTIPAGSLTATATVVINRDLHFEQDETFTVTMDLVSVGAATPGDTTAVITITNDDVQPTLLVSADNGGVIEGSSPPSTTAMQFTAILTAESYLPVSFDYDASSGLLPFPATPGTDFDAISGTVTIAPGDVTGFFTVTVQQDTIFERNETVLAQLSNLTGASISNLQITGIITNDDGAPNLTLTGSSVVEGDPPGVTPMVVTATLDVTSAVNTDVTYALVNVTTSNSDYVTPSPSTFTIPAGQLTTTFTIDAVYDQIAEQPAETFVVSVTNAPDVNQSTLPTLGRATMVITDDDYAPVSSSKTYTQPEDTQLLVTAGAGVLSGTTDLDDPVGPFTAVLVTPVTTGTLTLNGDGSFSYIPPLNFNGTAVFSFTVNDPHGNASITYTTSLIVQPVNDPPIANADTFTVTRDSVANQLLPLVNDSVGPDIGDQLVIDAIVVSPTNGTAVIAGGVEILYTPNKNFVGVDTLQYRVCDNGTPRLCAQAQVTIIVRDFRSFMPLIVKPPQPDLIVESITLVPNKLNFVTGEEVLIAVTIRNVGETSTNSTFWVDLFIEPSTPPDAANIRWNDRCNTALPTGNNCRGMAWEVRRTLAAGESFTLFSTRSLKPEDGGLDMRFSRWPGNQNSRLPEFFLPGVTSLYAYVDSWNPGVAVGAVNEKFEDNNRGQLLGLVVTAPGGAASLEPLAGPVESLPARPR